MIILGITGSVGTGKSFVSSFFKKQRVPVFDSDHESKPIIQKKKVLGIIMQNFQRRLRIIVNQRKASKNSLSG